MAMFSFTYDSLSFCVFLRWRLLVLTIIISVPEVSRLASCLWNPTLGTKSTHRVCKWQPSCPLFHVLCFSWAFHQEMRQNQQWGLPLPHPQSAQTLPCSSMILTVHTPTPISVSCFPSIGTRVNSKLPTNQMHKYPFGFLDSVNEVDIINLIPK